MAVHLGRLKIVTRRKDGTCRYKKCPNTNNRIKSGEKVLILTKMGSVEGKSTIFYKTFHPRCFGRWSLWMCEQTPTSRDGRKSMDMDSELKEQRAKMVRERARILRSLRYSTTDNLESKVERISELDKDITATGYPIIQYKNRRSVPEIEFEKFLKEVKGKYQTEMRVPRKVYDQARDMGEVDRFTESMEQWRQERIKSTQRQHFEDKQEDA